MNKITTTIVSISLLSFGSLAQLTSASSKQEYNQASGSLSNQGMYFNDFENGGQGYEIPKGDSTFALYISSFWYGALNQNDSLKLAAQCYGNGQDLFAGPFSTNGSYASQSYIDQYNPGMWKVQRHEIDQHIAHYLDPFYVVPPSIANWPGNGDALVGTSPQLAPYIDLNTNGVYEPSLGDYPEIKGCEATLIILNDDAGIHTEAHGEKLGIEIQLLFYQYKTNESDYLDYTTFVSQKIINRGAQNLHDFTVSNYTDADLGNSANDYFGCDSSRNLMYFYNGDADDETNGANGGYGVNPPAIGLKVLNQSLSSNVYLNGFAVFPYTNPTSAAEYWNLMQGKWANGSPIVSGGLGYVGSTGATTTQTTFTFPGNPNNPSEWSEVSAMSPQGDRRGVMSSNLGDFPSGATAEFDCAILFARAPGMDNLENVNALLAIADSAQVFYDSQLDQCTDPTAVLAELKDQPALFQLFPNPSAGTFSVQSLDQTHEMKMEVQDMTGRIVYTSLLKGGETIAVSLKEQAGLYLVKLQVGETVQVQKLIVE